MDYVIKQRPEDFIVRERSLAEPKASGSYSYIRVRKRNLTTMEAAEAIAAHLGIPSGDVGFAGAKDRAAVAEQVMSVKGDFRKKLESLSAANMDVEFLGKCGSPVSLGDLEGNDFEIIVRNAEKKPERISRFVNYFGEQRFSRNNAEVGKAIIKGDFRKAAALADNKRAECHLKEHKNDCIGALRSMPRRTLMMYLHSYQSLLWNRTAEMHVKQNREGANIAIPLVGFATEYKDDAVKSIVKDILEKEGVTERDFIIREMPEMSLEGCERQLFAEPEGLRIEDIGEGSYRISFFLPKGCYATEAVRQMLE